MVIFHSLLYVYQRATRTHTYCCCSTRAYTTRPTNMGWFDLGISTGNPWVFALKSGISIISCSLSIQTNWKVEWAAMIDVTCLQPKTQKEAHPWNDFRTWCKQDVSAIYTSEKEHGTPFQLQRKNSCGFYVLVLVLVDSTNRYNTILVTLLETYIVKIGPSWRGCWVRLALDKTKHYWGGFPKGYVSKPQPIVEANKSTPRIF